MVDLLDTASARVRMSLDTHSQQLMQISSELVALEMERHAIEQDVVLSPDIDPAHLADITDWSVVPLCNVLKDEQSSLLQLENELGKRVIGQEAALLILAQRLRASKTGLTSENAPLGVFLLVGPSGVDKTETVLALADSLFFSEQSLITINLSEC